MLVSERMSKPVLTIPQDTPVQEALAQMRRDKVRRFPVVNKHGAMVGMVSESDLLNASPSEATTLSVWEINYLLSKITVERVMARDVVTTEEDCPIEEAARIMADKKIGALPVMREGRLVGIVTETDIFKVLLEIFGVRKGGVRAALLVHDSPGKIAELTQLINQMGGNIISFGTFMGDDPTTGRITIKVENVKLADLKKALEPLVEKVLDIREVKPA
jgi:acetoin utilization protein AcuB